MSEVIDFNLEKKRRRLLNMVEMAKRLGESPATVTVVEDGKQYKFTLPNYFGTVFSAGMISALHDENIAQKMGKLQGNTVTINDQLVVFNDDMEKVLFTNGIYCAVKYVMDELEMEVV